MSEETGNRARSRSDDAARAAKGDRSGATAGERPQLFAGISPEDYARISAAGRARQFARGELLYFEGDQIKQAFLVTSGLVKTTRVGVSGAEVILELSSPGDVLGAISLFTTGRHSRNAQAFRACKVLAWEASTFKCLVDRYPVLYQNMVRILGEHLMELEERFREMATEKVGPRVASQLVRLWEKLGWPFHNPVEIGLSREDLAQMTGTTLFTVSRLLSAWEARGMVRPSRQTVTICDVASLRAVSEEGRAIPASTTIAKA